MPTHSGEALCAIRVEILLRFSCNYLFIITKPRVRTRALGALTGV